jgi:Coenzyme PQQ synthesis protein D (PqqD)
MLMQKNPQQIEGLDIEETDEGYIIYEPDRDRVHFLNSTAALILELCNGMNSIDGIAGLVQETFHLADPPTQAVQEVLTQMKDEGLLVE